MNSLKINAIKHKIAPAKRDFFFSYPFVRNLSKLYEPGTIDNSSLNSLNGNRYHLPFVPCVAII